MIHTFQIYVPHTNEDLRQMQKRFGFEAYDVNKLLHLKYPFAHFNIINHKQSGIFYLSIHIDAIKLLGRSNIQESDFQEVNRLLRSMVYVIFLDKQAYEEAFLVRIDYRYDVVIADQKERKIIHSLFKKLSEQYGWLKKHLGSLNTEGQYVPYETSVYHSSKSSGTLAYDKEAKCLSDGIAIMPYEKDVLRFEVRISKPHIDYRNSAKKCTNPRPRTLEAYFKQGLRDEYMKKMLLPIYFKGDFVKLSEAKSIILRSALSPIMKSRLVDFLQRMNYSKASVSSPLIKQLVSKPTYRSYMTTLADLNIHPVTIPKNVKGAPLRLSNPLSQLIQELTEKSH